ncbi:ABC-2 type transport system permease protein [Virgibacillus natechei]|uniref:ABC-2 type transport system permease protein n=1 Tax=Virgibacillus natechei TaxID=1216297 RepID=A0ABS4IDR3_9BACI|nr:ABC transporter permease [Virgibacillus natechei]MBP1969085.1 ABC-2 type transport system permease protein [Virgibacillus natechei]UZD14352.1 ABC transporter permease [Virgibacillus natechei]
MTIFAFALKRSFRKLINIVLLGGLPIIFVFLPDNGVYTLPIGYQFYGILLLFTSAKLVSMMLDDRVSGALLRIGASPVTHLQYLWQNLLAYSLLLILQSGAMIIGGMLYGHTLHEPGLLFLLYAVFSLTAISFSLAWFALFRHKETAFSILFGLIILISMAGGLFWPIDLMPDIMQKLVMVLPTYWLAEAQFILVGSGDLSDLFIPIGFLLLFTVIFLLGGSKRRIS